MTGQAENATSLAPPEAERPAMRRAQKLLTAGGVLGAIAASSCCILPLALFGLGVSGAWIGNLTRLAPYQPYFIAATVACLGCRLLAGPPLSTRSPARTARPVPGHCRTGPSRRALFWRPSSSSVHWPSTFSHRFFL